MLSPYRINPNKTNKRTKKAKNTNFDNNSHHEQDLKRPQITSNEHNRPRPTSNENSKKVKTRNNLKGGSVQVNLEINEHYLDGILDNNNIKVELAMQIISTDKTVRKDTIQDLKDFNQQSLTTQAKKGAQVVSMMPAIKKNFYFNG